MPELEQPRPAQRPAALVEQDPHWQMALGERVAIIGVVASIRPTLAIEIGTAQGGSLRRLADWSGHVHSFDIVEPRPEVAALENVTLHIGDSHALLPEVLGELARDGRNVDFVLVDGDHSADGVARDMRDLLDSPAIGATAIVMHDTMNPEVRRGLEAVDYGSYAKVRHVHLDAVAGFPLSAGLFAGELWGGLGVVIVDAEHPRALDAPFTPPTLPPMQPIVIAGLEADAAREAAVREERERGRAALEAATAEADQLRTKLAAVEGSRTWRRTEWMRRLKRRLR
jgi:Methyltransferase domain